MSKPLTLQIEEWDYNCGDGCCYEYGETLSIDDEEVYKSHMEFIDRDLVKTILKHLGYSVEWQENDF